VDVLEEGADNPVQQELEEALDALNVDEQLDLIALTWLGRGEYSSFAEAREEASDMRDKHIPEYLIGSPKLGDTWKKDSLSSAIRSRISSEIAYELTVTEVSPMKAEYRLPAGQVQEREREARC
jgi:Protein of unknown function (DUF3775)